MTVSHIVKRCPPHLKKRLEKLALSNSVSLQEVVLKCLEGVYTSQKGIRRAPENTVFSHNQKVFTPERNAR